MGHVDAQAKSVHWYYWQSCRERLRTGWVGMSSAWLRSEKGAGEVGGEAGGQDARVLGPWEGFCPKEKGLKPGSDMHFARITQTSWWHID